MMMVKQLQTLNIKADMETKIKKRHQRAKDVNRVAVTEDSTVFRGKPTSSSVNKSPDMTSRTVIKNKSGQLKKSGAAAATTSSTSNTKTPKILQKRFKLEKVLGVGGMGVVYKAIDLRKVEAKDRNPYVAIKVLNDDFKNHPDSLIALQREARKSQSIAHPNIVNVHDFDRDGDVVFMTMEFLDGQPLDKVVKQYQYIGLPMNQAWVILRGICDALIYAHQENIVHSDFKPGNIFMTSKGIAKVFDFGISRAVSVSDLKQDSGEKTLFDAGTLGALTPAYASLEMLNGEAPDISDDVYALGCVAYEIFSGEHPFAKLSADKAQAKKLKVKRIQELSNKQWNALKKALAFRRKDRLSSVEEFYQQMFSENTSGKMLLSTIAISLTIGLASVVYYQFLSDNVSAVNIESSSENISLYKDDITTLLSSPEFSSIQWHEDIWLAFKSLWKLVPDNDKWSYTTESRVVKLYADEINKLIDQKKLNEADILLSEASKFTDNNNVLVNIKRSIQSLRSDIGDQEIARLKKLQYEQKRRFEAQKANLRNSILNEQKQNAAEIQRRFNIALNDVSKHLLCRSGINVRKFSKSLKTLSSIDDKKYLKVKPELIKSTINCINNISVDSQSKAEKLKAYAIQFFPSSQHLRQLQIGRVDLCKPAYAGKAAKNSRSVCQDALSNGVSGPTMVVVKPEKDRVYYAISKYEVSNRDFNHFCQSTGKCRVHTVNMDYPVSNIHINMARAYVSWLSKTTNQNYSLPTHYQWLKAAQATGSALDPNRNCSMNSRGVIKGASLVTVTSGKQNSWGVVNSVGNVQEWVIKGSKNELYAAGGSRIDEFVNCNISSLKKHSGKGNEYTGFRVVREII